MEVKMTQAQEKTEEIQQPKPNPYNAKKTWDNSNSESEIGFQSADDSLAYVTPRKEAVISSKEPILQQEGGQAKEAEPTKATNTDDYVEEPTEQFKKVDFKKRYDDLKRHYDRKLGDWRQKETALKADLKANRQTYVAPKTPEELATFREDYPDVYDVVDSLAHMRAQEQISSLEDKVSVLSEKELASNRRAAEHELLNAHPDFRTIRDSDDFHDWARVQPDVIQDWIYKNTGDASLASRAIDLYKQDAGFISETPRAQSTESSSSDPRGSAADAVSVKVKSQDPTTPQERIWTTSEIANLSVDQYEKFQPEIDEAFKTGRIAKG
jgi:uncharacterized protein YutD